MSEPEAEAEIRVRGGIAGIAAHLEDLERAGSLLRSVAAELADRGRAVMAIAMNPLLQITAPSSPRTYSQAEKGLIAAATGPGGLLRLAARIEVLAVGLTVTAEAYRGADSVAARGLGFAAASIGQAVGDLVAPAVPGVLAGVIATVVVTDLVTDKLRDPLSDPRGPVPGRMSEPVRRLGRLTLRLLADHAGLAELLVPATGGAISAVTGGRLTSGSDGRPLTAANIAPEVELFAGVAGALAADHPWLREQDAVRVQPSRAYPSRPAVDLGDVVARIPLTPQIHVERVDTEDGSRRWVVSVPGTVDWSLTAARTPFDLTGDVQLMAGRRSAGMSGVIEAMRAVGVGQGEPVLLVGHSQGGLIAAELAADPAVRREFRVTHVITTGAPVASVRIPDDVQVLSIEHTDDLVPALDGSANRDRPNWVTVSAPAPLVVLPKGSARSAPLIAHRAELYQLTAARLDSSKDPSITAWRAGVTPFLGGRQPDGPQRPTVAWDVDVSRVGTR